MCELAQLVGAELGDLLTNSVLPVRLCEVFGHLLRVLRRHLVDGGLLALRICHDVFVQHWYAPPVVTVAPIGCWYIPIADGRLGWLGWFLPAAASCAACLWFRAGFFLLAFGGVGVVDDAVAVGSHVGQDVGWCDCKSLFMARGVGLLVQVPVAVYCRVVPFA